MRLDSGPVSDDLILGLDGGGSKTVLALVDRRGVAVMVLRGPGLDPTADSPWERNLDDLVEGLGSLRARVRFAVLGLSAHTEIEAVSERQKSVAAGFFPECCAVLNDVHVAFIGALAGRAGVLALAGTGSMAWAGDGEGLDRRVGGWGDAFGDEGSAYWIGREALSAATRALDGRTGAVAFARALLRHLGLGEPDIIGWVNELENRRSVLAALAEVVDGLARAGDPTALDLLRRAADHLVEHVDAAWRLIGSPHPRVWTYAGGLFASDVFTSRMSARLGEPMPPKLPPVGGAVLHAAQVLGWTMDGAWRHRLAASLQCEIRPGGIRGSHDGRGG